MNNNQTLPPLSDKQFEAFATLRIATVGINNGSGERYFCTVRLLDHRRLAQAGIQFPSSDLLVTGTVTISSDQMEEIGFRWDYWTSPQYGPTVTLYTSGSSSSDPSFMELSQAVVKAYLDRFWSDHIAPLLN